MAAQMVIWAEHLAIIKAPTAELVITLTVQRCRDLRHQIHQRPWRTEEAWVRIRQWYK